MFLDHAGVKSTLCSEMCQVAYQNEKRKIYQHASKTSILVCGLGVGARVKNSLRKTEHTAYQIDENESKTICKPTSYPYM